ncbi:hypothetical protein Tco_0818715 [Tanacetum coccineum]
MNCYLFAPTYDLEPATITERGGKWMITDDESEEQELEAHYLSWHKFKRLIQILLTILDTILDDEPMISNDIYLRNKVTPIALLIHRILFDRCSGCPDETDDLDQEVKPGKNVNILEKGFQKVMNNVKSVEATSDTMP